MRLRPLKNFVSWLWQTKTGISWILWIVAVLSIWQCVAYVDSSWIIVKIGNRGLWKDLAMACISGLIIYFFTVVLKNWNLYRKKGLSIADRILMLASEFKTILEKIDSDQDSGVFYKYTGPAYPMNKEICLLTPLYQIKNTDISNDDTEIELDDGVKVEAMAALHIFLLKAQDVSREIMSLDSTILTDYQIRGLTGIMENELLQVLTRLRAATVGHEERSRGGLDKLNIEISKLIRYFNIALNESTKNKINFSQINLKYYYP